MAIRAILYYMFTTFTAIIVALVLSITIRPGSRAKNIKNNTVIISEGPVLDQKIIVINTIFDLIRYKILKFKFFKF